MAYFSNVVIDQVGEVYSTGFAPVKLKVYISVLDIVTGFYLHFIGKRNRNNGNYHADLDDPITVILHAPI